MHVISESTLKRFWEIHPESKIGLKRWYTQAKQANWQSFQDIRDTFPSADLVANFVVFNIGGNNYRLITFIDFQAGKLFIRNVLTHAEYDKERWKQDNWYNS